MQSRAALFAICLASTALVRAAAGADDPASFEVGPLKFQRPPEWKWVPVSSPMRKAQLSIPGAAPDKAAELTFFHFGQGQGGDVQANAQRWLRQFKSKEGAEKVEPLETGGAKVTLVSTEGTFASGMPGQPAKAMDDYALLGAIIEDDSGAVFAKMTGPSATVKAARVKFIDFIKAAAAKK
jgi:hypothetical protein